MKEFFEHPVWTDFYSRNALCCMLLELPLIIGIPVFPGLDFILVRIACILMLAAFILIFIVYQQIRLKPDQLLMREEMDLFSEILTYGRTGAPASLYNRHTTVLNECVRRGFTVIETGGWKEYQPR